MANNITEYLGQLQEIANQNLELLKTLNESFLSEKSHITTTIAGESISIPSFLGLESRLVNIENNFQHLVDAPKTGDAVFMLPNGSQKITMNGYGVALPSFNIDEISDFKVNQNDILKDFLTPQPYIYFPLKNITQNIKHFNVKKIAIKNGELISSVFPKDNTKPSIKVEYSDIKKKLFLFKDNVDYVEYDTLMRLEPSQAPKQGRWTIKKIEDNLIDENFSERYSLELNESLDYTIDSGTIRKRLERGMKLVTGDDRVMMEVEDVAYDLRKVVVRITNGAYANLSTVNGTTTNTLFLYSEVDVNREVKITLEEDQYILIFIAVCNDTTNAIGIWNEGLAIDTFKLQMGDKLFNDYYKENVNNIGDKLLGITNMVNTVVDDISYENFEKMSEKIPVINPDGLKIVEINGHLTKNIQIENIKNLHSQKEQFKSDLDNINKEITDTNNILSELTFDGDSESRNIYVEQLRTLNNKKSDIIKNINSIILEINNNAQDTSIPLEANKYRLRGFIDVPDANVIKIIVEYQYVNADASSTPTEYNINNKTFSSWNRYSTIYRYKNVRFENNRYKFEYPVNEDIKFNQIDIPVSQGESVNVRVKYIYEAGFPFIEFTSKNSNIVNFQFPKEFIKNAELFSILEENTNEWREANFNNILTQKGIDVHVGDKIQDQDKVYFHNPLNISSGFFTPERRIIPLSDKLINMDLELKKISDEIFGTSSTDLSISIINEDIEVPIYPGKVNEIQTKGFDEMQVDKSDDTKKGTVITIKLANNTTRPLKLFTMFPGAIVSEINGNTKSVFEPNDYLNIFINQPVNKSDGSINPDGMKSQVYNQFLYFRNKNIYDNENWYESFESGIKYDTDNILASDEDHIKLVNKDSNGAALYPKISDPADLTIGGDTLSYYKSINPGQYLLVNLVWECRGITKDSISKTTGFDIRTSLYQEPQNYIVKVTTHSTNNITQRIIREPQRKDVWKPQI